MNKRKGNSFWPILGQYYLHRHSVSITNILKITGLVKHCPIFYGHGFVVISLVCETVSCVMYKHYFGEFKVQVVAHWCVRSL